jgi:hypothetical protein
MFSIDNAGISYHPLRFFLDTPYRLSFLHFKECCSQETHTPRSLCHRVSHFCLGLLHIIPLINSIAAIAGQILPNSHKKPASSPLPLPPLAAAVIHPLSSCFTPEEIAHLSPESTSLLEEITKRQKEVRETIERTPFFPLIAGDRPASYTSKIDHAKIRYPLVKAILEKDWQKIKETIECPQVKSKTLNAHIVPTEWDSYSPLQYALIHQDDTLFQLLINSKKINTANRPSESLIEIPIKAFFKAGTEEEEIFISKKFIIPLIEKGAPLPSKELIDQINTTQKTGETLNRIKDFIKSNEKNKDGYTELHRAVLENNIEQVQAALTKGSYVHTYGGTYYRKSAIQLVCDNLLKYQSLHNKDFQRAIAILHLLLEKGADPYGYDNSPPALKILSSHFLEDQEELIYNIIKNHEGNYFDLGRLLDKEHRIIKTLKDKFPEEAIEKGSKRLLSTLWEITERWNGQTYSLSGFHSIYTYSHLMHCLKTITEEELRNLECSTDEWQLFTDATEKALRLLSQKSSIGDLSQVIAEDFSKGLLTIPVESDGHASCFVISGDYILTCNKGAAHARNTKHQIGIRIQKVSGDKSKIYSIMAETIGNAHCEKELSGPRKAQRIEEITNHIPRLSQEIFFIELEEQSHQNCTWSSSAFLSLQAIKAIHQIQKRTLSLENFAFSENDRLFFNKFNNYARFKALEHYMKDLNENLKNFSLEVDKSSLEKTAQKALALLALSKQDQNDLFLKRSLDLIFESGFPICLSCEKKDIQDDLPQELQAISNEDFKKACEEYLLDAYAVPPKDLFKVLKGTSLGNDHPTLP